MLLKESIKTKICIIRLEPNFPLREFVEWAEALDKQLVLQILDEIQIELDMQEQQNPRNLSASHCAMFGYWCFYCAQARAYYRAIIRNPQHQAKWFFLL